MESKQNTIVFNKQIYSLTGAVNVYRDIKKSYDNTTIVGHRIIIDYGKHEQHIMLYTVNYFNDLEKTKKECDKLFNIIKRIIK